MERRNLRNWNVAKNNVHDLSGIENPEQWKWERIDGVFYPAEKIEVAVENEEEKRMFAELDPDWTDEEIIAHGWMIKDKTAWGNTEVIDYREGCGHLVMPN
jgi:hypothetical protein